MQKKRVVRNENMRQWLQTEGEMYLDLLKKGPTQVSRPVLGRSEGPNNYDRGEQKPLQETGLLFTAPGL